MSAPKFVFLFIRMKLYILLFTVLLVVVYSAAHPSKRGMY